MNGQNGVVGGPDLYSEMQRLISEWYGLDDGVRSGSLPQLVKDLVRLQQSYTVSVARACHDCTEAA